MRLLSWSITGMFLKSPGGGFQMEEEPRTLQVLSSAISSICAVISNYWSLIEVHVEYSPSLSLSLEADEYPPLTYYTKWHSWRSDVSSQSSFSAPSLSSPPAPLSLGKQLAPFDVWLASHWVTFTAASDRVSIHAILRTPKLFSIWHHAANTYHGLPLLLPDT